ncbi:DUF1173 domain-containing protein [Burkholderia ubonensis]|uniref:DUF1173 domain-containing protein n=1 Tax=Burkholderia ubonensis TaxID=101571 RepID=UPI0007538942|nr:DUF1173 domain-containing protein [Burkholderia ubonensis]KWK77717.1 hypothetical protein WM15_26935 [Burkholderia ubonensis]
MASYEIAGKEYEAATPELLAVLPGAHDKKIRPLCMCQKPGVEMYIARFEDRFLVKRMPDTAGQHKVGCDSYDAPPELSGLGDVEGSAIQEDLETGRVALKFGFAMSKGGQKQAPAPSEKEPDSVKADGKKLTLRATLHYLWEQAGLNRWSPAMKGKRSWYVIRKYLLQAATDKVTKGVDLSSLLYIPESFVADQKDAIQQRRTERIARIVTSPNGAQRYMLAIGELKEIAPSRYGHKLVLKHLPDYGLMLDDDVHKRLKKRFEAELELWNVHEEAHMVAIATASVSRAGIASVVEVALMLTTEQWIPFESEIESTLLKAIAARRYMKCLRYNLPLTRPLATAVLSDTERATALYLVPPAVTEAYQAALDDLLAGSQLDSWVWAPLKSAMPALPEPLENWKKLMASRAGRLPYDVPDDSANAGERRDARSAT